ncbi:MAG: hypothetical protein R3B54_17660 [Bdellovibrionota bacterium]
MRKLLLISLLLGATLNAQESTSPHDPQKYLSEIAGCADRIDSYVRLLGRKYVTINMALERDALGPIKPVPPHYAEQFDKLFVSVKVTRGDFFEEVGIDFALNKFPRLLEAASKSLVDKWENDASDDELASAFGSLDKAYWRTLAASYTLIEYAKRQYYYNGAQFYLGDADDRTELEKEIRGLHYELQNMMEYMYVLRTDSQFARLDPGKFTPHLFEGTYGSTFHFRQEKLDIMKHGPIRELVYYLIPAAYPRLMAGMKEVPLPKADDVEFIAPKPEKENPGPAVSDVPTVEKPEKPVPPPPRPGLEAKNQPTEPEVLPTPEPQPGEETPQPKPLSEPKMPKAS